jgi:PAS domain-containing protein
LQKESKDFIILLEEVIEKIRNEDEYFSFIVGNMAAIFEHSDDAIIGIDNDGNILSWNNGATKIYGYSIEEAIGKNISILVPPDNIDELKCLLKKS